jgi:hypothetical protein
MNSTVRGTRRRRAAIGGSLAAAALVASLIAAVPASAIGGNSKQCFSNGTAYGDSSATGAATSVTAGVLECGQAKAAYRYLSGGVIVSTAYVYSSTVAYRAKPSGVTGVGGKHSVVYPGAPYLNNFPFLT